MEDQPHQSRQNLARTINSSLTLADYLEPHLSTLEKEYLETVLADNVVCIAASANQAGVSRRTILSKLRAYEINKHHFRSKNPE